MDTAESGRNEATARASLLRRCLAGSVVLHGAFALFGGVAPQRHALDAHPVMQASIRIAADPRAGLSAPGNLGVAPSTARARNAQAAGPRTSPDAVAVAAATPDGARESGDGFQRRAPRDNAQLTVASFDPAEYFPPSEVDLGALPANEDLFDTLPLTGFQPGYWLVRLFIDQEGDVRELQFVESRGSERNAEELRFILSQSRFTPARRGESNVKSQKMVEFSFEPGTPTLVSATLPDPSATER